MKMVIVLAVCLALSAGSASALQMALAGLQLQALALYPCAEYLRQPQCSPMAAAAPFVYAIAQQTIFVPSAICQPLRQQCCQQMMMMDMQSQCQAMCGVVHSVVQHLKMTMQLQGVAAASSQAVTPVAMVVAQVAQNLPAMCGLYQLPSYCTTPCAVSAVIQPYY